MRESPAIRRITSKCWRAGGDTACYCRDLVEGMCTIWEWCGEAARRSGGDLVGVRDAMADFGGKW
jgi:hypothetical protein